MHLSDESKTAFMTEFASYCYKVMPFGLKNISVNYQRLMDRILTPLLGRNVQAYVDDIGNIHNHQSVGNTNDHQSVSDTNDYQSVGKPTTTSL